MARASTSSASSTPNHNGVGSSIQKSFKSMTQYVSRTAKEHHAGVNDAYQTFYGLNVSPSRRTSAASSAN